MLPKKCPPADRAAWQTCIPGSCILVDQTALCVYVSGDVGDTLTAGEPSATIMVGLKLKLAAKSTTLSVNIRITCWVFIAGEPSVAIS